MLHTCQREGHGEAECLKGKADEAGRRSRKEKEGGQTAFTATTAMVAFVSNDWIISTSRLNESDLHLAL